MNEGKQLGLNGEPVRAQWLVTVTETMTYQDAPSDLGQFTKSKRKETTKREYHVAASCWRDAVTEALDKHMEQADDCTRSITVRQVGA